ncbi:MAG: hypothetical protein HYR60_12785 [Acidobacteria bacterium]|nr:hypothetical protein [Acidobacteriota bacterium]
MHDRLLETLQSVAQVRLVAALRDDRIGFAGPKDLRIFIPDIHLISEKRQREGGFLYSTNYPDLLTRLVLALTRLKTECAEDESALVYQIGDFLDLWRESPGLDDQLDAAAGIKDDHEDLVTALLDRRLKTRFLLGNHDFDLYRWPAYGAWERRYYLPGVLMLHGDLFDWVEALPDQIQDVVVFLLSPNVPPNDYALGQMKSLIRRTHAGRNYRAFIGNPRPAALGALGTVDAIPERWNVQSQGKFFDSAARCAAQGKADYGLDLKAVVIGHTHQARIVVRENAAGDFFALVDCGAWIEECMADGDSAPSPNAQIAALCANEFRIYQLAPR